MKASAAWTIGTRCEAVALDEATREWLFRFSDGSCLQVASPWRIIADGRIALGHGDHGQQFGRPEPVDGIAAANELLRGRSTESITIADQSSDLAIGFEGGRHLEVFNSSSGYEAWMFNTADGRWVVGQGGGSLVEATKRR